MARKPKPFIPPTLKEVEQYVKDNGFHFDPLEFIRYYEDADPAWTFYDRDGKQKYMKNWKQKARMVWEKIALSKPKKCYCGKPGVYLAGHDDTGQAYFRCVEHKPYIKPAEIAKNVKFREVPQEDTRSNSDKVNEQRYKLNKVISNGKEAE